MDIEQFHWTVSHGWRLQSPAQAKLSAQLVLIFGSASALQDLTLMQQVRSAYPQATLLGCSTAGEICDTWVRDQSLVATAIEFEYTTVQSRAIELIPGESSYEAGKRLAQAFEAEDLTHLFVLSDGIQVNGSDLVRGLMAHLPPETTLTGGLSGDGDRFQETWVLCDQVLQPGLIAAVGLYGDRLQVGVGSLGGWAPFGPKRTITKSINNVLYELDGQSALALYKNYLGEQAADLPAAGLLFPLSVRLEGASRTVVRTILSVDEAAQSMTFAGDVPQGATVQLMRGSFNRLVDGAIAAAETSLAHLSAQPPTLAILISCVGRKLVLKQRVEEEVEGVRSVVGEQTYLTGFYSYGEIAPAAEGCSAELHNQTMTITTLTEQALAK
ncbi:FIST signal transduction protein [Almyronema epifaneia]|uniref:FIST signal transduction protein n=1 Tax=Almyronema epifaneia S1 TaxID=2991925 RepID=A0ABW6ICK1_9CYAN